jgi:hypothetical protein
VLDGVESSRWTILLSITSVDNLIWGGEDWRLMEMRDKCDSVVFMYDGDLLSRLSQESQKLSIGI